MVVMASFVGADYEDDENNDDDYYVLVPVSRQLPHVQDLATTASAMWVLQRLLVEEDSLGIGERELANALISNTSLDKLVSDPLGDHTFY